MGGKRRTGMKLIHKKQKKYQETRWYHFTLAGARACDGHVTERDDDDCFEFQEGKAFRIKKCEIRELGKNIGMFQLKKRSAVKA